MIAFGRYASEKRLIDVQVPGVAKKCWRRSEGDKRDSKGVSG